MITTGDWNLILRDCNIQYIVGVPSSELSPLFDNSSCETIISTREDEAIGVAAGLKLTDSNVLVAIQSSGLGNIFNALGSLVIPYDIKLMIMISIRGGPEEKNEVQKTMGNASQSLLNKIGIETVTPTSFSELHSTIKNNINNQIAILLDKGLLK